ncbi:hypothetical protein [Pseudomonas sp. G5(2012)]|uniref:hypothetical protein n=1 Tax=Pseudomonas sp. G5(2012) TaxID=1268068 RepID=UPI0005B483A0|nr:hypothetical protein [Pseudomonas sp. G5(2012)]
MSTTAPDIENIKHEYRRDIAKFQKMLRVMHSISDIRYIYSYLSNLEVNISHEFIMLSEALTTSLVIGYGRLFTETDGVTRLNSELIPENIKPLHEQIMGLRHERYAHHGDHESVSTNIDIKLNDGSITVNSNLEYVLCLGAPKEWAPLFKWLDEHIWEKAHAELEKLSKKTGLQWEMPSGPAPYWIPE